MPQPLDGLTLSNYSMVGDPEWIGILQRPDAPYGPNNPFVARYAFIAVPVGNTLDLNAIHNQVFDENNPNINGFIRVNSTDCGWLLPQPGRWLLGNQSRGFLTDLNTNQWGQSTATR